MEIQNANSRPWKSHGNSKCKFQALEKSWKFKMQIPGSGKVMEIQNANSRPWKSHGNSKCKFQALEKLWKFKMQIPGPGKVMEIQNANSRPWKGYGKLSFRKFWKSHGNVTKVASNIIYILANRRNSNTIMIINTV